MNITKQLTKTNFTKSNNANRIKYVVIHYVGATGGAKNNADFYGATYRGASAHYFVGFDGEIYQVVEDKDISWAVGTKGKYSHPVCRNSNSISIEMCVRNKNGTVNRTDKDAGWYFENETIAETQKLTKMLMDKYNIPIDNVLRHYDVTGKCCPAPYCNGQLDWGKFKMGILNKNTDTDKKWYDEAKTWVAQNKIADGNRADAPATRAEVWQMLYNYKKNI